MSNNYMKKSLIYGSGNIALIRMSEVRKSENGDIGSASGNTARQCIHEWDTQVGRVGEEQ